MSFKQVKNRAPAPIQITAEQLLREAKERGIDEIDKAPDVHIKDREELLHYQTTKRKGFEDQLRGKRVSTTLWARYALWEASQKEFERARSVFERALDVDYKSQTLWLKYAEMEMKHKFINHARNIWDRSHPLTHLRTHSLTHSLTQIGACLIYHVQMFIGTNILTWRNWSVQSLKRGTCSKDG